MWNGKTISVILPTYNEKDSIRRCIINFFNTGVVDEVVVVNNNAVAGTSEEVQGTGAREVFEERQGYGAAIRRGFREAKGDLIVVCEPDGTFSEEDIFKLLAYAMDHDIVFGSRTVKEFIWSGSNMGGFLRWGNYGVAKLMEVLFNTNSLSDVGCTYRLISRPAFEKMQPYFRVYDNYFGPEMMLLAARLDISFVQIPVNYKPRVGKSSVTGDPFKAFLLGFQMILLILTHRMEGSLKLSTFYENNNFGSFMISYRYYYLYLIVFLLVAFWIKKPLTEYLIGDASLFMLLVHSALGLMDTPLIDLTSGASIWHPFLYQSILIITGKLFGTELLKMRLIGAVCLLFDLYLLRKIANRLVDNQKDGRMLTLLTCIFFLFIPLTIDGALHIDIDNTIMTPLMLIFYYYFIRLEQEGIRYERYWSLIILMCILMPLLLFSKLTTPLALPVAIGVFYLLKGKPKKAIFISTLLALIGGCLFLLLWYLFCHFFHLPFSSLFQRYITITSNAVFHSTNSSYLHHIRHITIIGFWLNTTMVLLWFGFLFSTCKRLWKGQPVSDPLLFSFILTTIVGTTYLYIGNISFGLAKYHYPLIPFIALSIAYYTYPFVKELSLKSTTLYLTAIVCLSFLYYFVEDPIYLLTRGLKVQELSNLPYEPVLTNLAVVLTIYILPSLILLAVIFRYKLRQLYVVLVLLALSQMIGFNFHRSSAAYHTSHGYGYYGAAAVYKKISGLKNVLFSEGLIVAPFDPFLKYNPLNVSSPERIIPYISLYKPDAFVFGAPCNTVAHLKNHFLNPSFHQEMAKFYHLEKAGDYLIYLKSSP
ncbi:MAG: glycosyltransferase [Syntrophobacterales bacterium]|nr:glycosyltransferase [Syntrophobacterales bacterium]